LHQGDQRQPHDSGRAVDPAYLSKLGVLYHQINSQAEVDQLAAARNYKNRDEITVSPEKMGDIYEEKVKSFFHEHLHEDEEIRYILDGAGFFDVRSEGDDWVRIWLEKGDLIILPSGIYHRFTTDEQNVSLLEACGSLDDSSITRTKLCGGDVHANVCL
jgi:cupin superfamily acireductone dioxygenase involved in methionine salvage